MAASALVDKIMRFRGDDVSDWKDMPTWPEVTLAARDCVHGGVGYWARRSMTVAGRVRKFEPTPVS
jgi:hypothetical protein